MSYEYHEPETVHEAVGLLEHHGREAMVLAGGTAFMILARLGLVRPSHLIGLRRIPDLRGITATERGIWIGAHVTHWEIERSSEIRSSYPALADAFAGIATPRIRAQATIGGNLAHADPAQDPPPALISHNATAHIAGASGTTREVMLENLFSDYFSTVLGPHEILTGVTIPPPAPNMSAVYMKFLPRSADDYATVAVGGTMTRAGDGAVASVRLALGGVGPIPLRPRSVEAALIGQQPTPSLLVDAAALVDEEIDPLDDERGSAGYKRRMAVVWVARALERLADEGGRR